MATSPAIEEGSSTVSTGSAPRKAGAWAMAAVPSHTRAPVLVAEATRSASVIAVQCLLVEVSKMKDSKMSGWLWNSCPVEVSTKVRNPRPWPNSCRSTLTRSILSPWASSRP